MIIGLQSRDLLTGNAGADRFVYTSIVDAGDIINDFNPQEGDRVDLSGVLGSLGYNGTTPIRRWLPHIRGLRNNTILQIDPDGLGPATAKNYILFRKVSLATLNIPDNFIVFQGDL